MHQRKYFNLNFFINEIFSVEKFSNYGSYCIVGKFGWGKLWQIDSFQIFGRRKFGELIDQPIDY